jgi:uroporphyrinogen-III synthase
MSDLSDLADVYYDILAFFSPTGIKSLFMNFPDFEQNNTRIAVLEVQQKSTRSWFKVISCSNTSNTFYDYGFRKYIRSQ